MLFTTAAEDADTGIDGSGGGMGIGIGDGSGGMDDTNPTYRHEYAIDIGYALQDGKLGKKNNEEEEDEDDVEVGGDTQLLSMMEPLGDEAGKEGKEEEEDHDDDLDDDLDNLHGGAYCNCLIILREFNPQYCYVAAWSCEESL